jgi:hypothetical protein
MTRTPTGRFQKGASGNPRGRPRSSLAGRVRERVAEHLDELVDLLLAAARKGDIGATRTLLERVAPALKAEESTVPLRLPDGADLAATGRAVLAQTAAGELAPGQAGVLLSGLATLARVVEVDELERRLATLEERLDASGNP